MSERIIFKEENEKDFWRYWQDYAREKRVSPRYLKTTLKYRLAISAGDSLLHSDKSFVYLANQEVKGCIFLPIEKKGDTLRISLKGDYVDAPLFKNDKKLEKKIFSKIDEIAQEYKVAKIMFSVDPLEKDRFSYNYLQKYNYLDASILVYFITIPGSGELLKSCRRNHRRSIKYILKNKDFSVFYIDKNNPSDEIFKEYILLHHRCSGRVTRPQETFELQYQALKEGNAVLFGLNCKGRNIAYYYFTHNANKAISASAADNPEYDNLPLYHILLYSAMQYFQKKGVDYIDASQPSNLSTQIDYYPDKKQLNIAHFKNGFFGEFVNNFRAVKYFSKELFEQDIKEFISHYISSLKIKLTTKLAKANKIFSQRIYLRELSLDDVSLEYCRWLNDPEVNKYLETRSCTMEELKKYVQKQIDDPDSLLLGVFDKENKKHIGNIKLEPIDWQRKKAGFGILIGNKQYWAKGIGTEVAKLTIRLAFHSLGLNELELGVIPENKRARKVFEKVGFKVADIVKEATNHDGVLYDQMIMTIKKNNLTT